VKAIRTANVFNGKEKQHSERVIRLLYDSGPLSAWELAGKLSRVGSRVSMHSTLNKRLRALEKKGYVQRENEKWYLLYKGIIAAILIQKNPKIWNPVWKEIFDEKIDLIKIQLTPLFGTDADVIKDTMKKLGLSLESFDVLVALSKKIKVFMSNGIDYDTIKIATLLLLVNLEYMDPKTLLQTWTTLWNSKQDKSTNLQTKNTLLL
jgi:hypothetical protein